MHVCMYICACCCWEFFVVVVYFLFDGVVFVRFFGVCFFPGGFLFINFFIFLFFFCYYCLRKTSSTYIPTHSGGAKGVGGGGDERDGRSGRHL